MSTTFLNLVKYVFIVLAFSFFSQCVPMTSPQSGSAAIVSKPMQYRDHIYEPNIKTVKVYRASRRNTLQLVDDVMPLGGSDYFVLSFDEINADYKQYFAKYVSCDAYWTPSRFTDLQFLNDFNEFRITDYEYSINSIVPYTSYQVELPKVKHAGNYIVKVYRDNNEKDLVLTKRVVFYNKKVGVGAKQLVASGGASRYTDHRVEFAVTHSNMEIVNPLRDLKVVIRQNRRWDNVIAGLQPTQIRNDQDRLEYFHFGEENRFPSPREYRFFDIRTFKARGRYVDKIINTGTTINAFLYPDKSRKGLSYKNALVEDFNGNYYIQNQEPGLSEMEAQYINVNFFFGSEKLTDPIYVLGAFNLWEMDDKNRMVYDEELKGYRYASMLRQGYYNYAYISGNKNEPYPFDGARFEAENEYEIFVYFKEPIAQGDELIGYQRVVFNRR